MILTSLTDLVVAYTTVVTFDDMGLLYDARSYTGSAFRGLHGPASGPPSAIGMFSLWTRCTSSTSLRLGPPGLTQAVIDLDSLHSGLPGPMRTGFRAVAYTRWLPGLHAHGFRAIRGFVLFELRALRAPCSSSSALWSPEFFD